MDVVGEGFLVEVCRSYEYDDYSLGPGEMDAGWSKVGNHFLVGIEKDDIELKMREVLQNPAPVGIIYQ